MKTHKRDTFIGYGAFQTIEGWLGEAKVSCILSPGRPADIGLQLGKACCPCSR